MAAKVNIESFRKAVRDRAPSMKKFMFNAAQTRYVAAKKEFLEEVESHPVSQEIEEGPSTENGSEGLGMPNLFAFIGFQEGSDPVKKLVDFLEKSVVIHNNCTISYTKSKVTFSFVVDTPLLQEIAEVTPLPFDSSKSWVVCVEKGLFGLSHFLNGMLLNPPKTFDSSRSSTGLESKYLIRNREYQPQPYLTPMLKAFQRQLRSGKE